MADYYQILGLSQTATAAQIRAAFKRLAMQYHPDRNPNNPMAEEIFKQVNEAYHILSDPLKKARHDSRFYTYETQSSTQAAEAYAREMRHRQQQARSREYRKPEEKTYTLTGNYFKIQGLAFLVFLVMSGISFGIVHVTGYFFDLKLERERKVYREQVKEVNTMFGAGKIDEAITRIASLNEKSPLNFYFRNAHDSLVGQIGRMADREFDARNFDRALYYYEHFKKYQDRGQTAILQKISISQYNVGRYADAVQTLKQLLSEQPWSLELIYQLAMINLQQLNNVEEAMFYFNLGEKTFRENLTQIYGEAYMVAIDPADIPDIYYEIFIAKAQTEITLKQYDEADGDLELAIYLRPAQPAGYYHRAILNIARHKRSTVCADLAKAKTLGAENTPELQKKYCR